MLGVMSPRPFVPSSVHDAQGTVTENFPVLHQVSGDETVPVSGSKSSKLILEAGIRCHAICRIGFLEIFHPPVNQGRQS